MSTALPQHHRFSRAQVIAAAAALAAVAAVGIGLEASNDDSTPTTTENQSTTSLPQFKLTGTSHESGNWHHAGTTSGGHQSLDLPQ